MSSSVRRLCLVTMQPTLRAIERLLRAYGYTYQANLADIAAETFARDPITACRLLNSGEWWNDRDAICAIDLAIDGGFTPEARQDGRRLRQALIEVFTTMRAYGERNDGGELIVSQLQKWLDSAL